MKNNIYLILFKEMFLLSLFTFGGGYVIIVLMRKIFVEKYQFMTNDEIIDLTTIAQTAPGAVAVNASLLLGYKLKGKSGAIVSVIATILPPMIILTAISYAYDFFIQNSFFANTLSIMSAVVSAIIFDNIITMLVPVLKARRKIQYVSLALAIIAVFMLELNIIYVMLIAFIIAFIYTFLIKKEVY